MVSAQNYILRATVISRHFKTHIRIRYGVPPVKDIISRHHNAIPSAINYYHGGIRAINSLAQNQITYITLYKQRK